MAMTQEEDCTGRDRRKKPNSIQYSQKKKMRIFIDFCDWNEIFGKIEFSGNTKRWNSTVRVFYIFTRLNGFSHSMLPNSINWQHEKWARQPQNVLHSAMWLIDLVTLFCVEQNMCKTKHAGAAARSQWSMSSRHQHIFHIHKIWMHSSHFQFFDIRIYTIYIAMRMQAYCVNGFFVVVVAKLTKPQQRKICNRWEVGRTLQKIRIRNNLSLNCDETNAKWKNGICSTSMCL